MAWPSLPDTLEPVMSESQQSRWEGLNDKQRNDIERTREYNKHEEDGNAELALTDENYPVGDFFGTGNQQQDW
jgi:hypothetical protein